MTRLIRDAAPYQLIAGQLYRQGKDGVMRRCVREDEFILILDEAHSGIAGGHFTVEATARKVLQAGLWWPTLFGDAVEFVKRCDPCQRATKPQNWDRMPLSMNLATQPFEKWGIDFVGPISPAAINSQARYIIVATDYFTKWAEARATHRADVRSTSKFLYELVISRYRCPLELISDRGSHFLNELIVKLTMEFTIIHRKSSAYYPQANG